MKEKILNGVVLLCIVACGAQNNPTEEITVPSNTTPEETVAPPVVLKGSDSLFPKSGAIDCPNSLKRSANLIFNKSVERVQQIIDKEKDNLNILTLVQDAIGEECPEVNSSCSFPEDYFRVNYQHQTLLLGAIALQKSKVDENITYNLLLSLNDNVSIQYEWKSYESSVFTSYYDGNNSVKTHYFSEDNSSESNGSEASYIDDNLGDEKNSFMINVEKNGSSLYFLSSNHIKDNQQLLSTNLRVQDKVLVEDNASFFNNSLQEERNVTAEDANVVTADNNLSLGLGTLTTFSATPPDMGVMMEEYIMEKVLDNGDYLIFLPKVEVENLNLIEKLKLNIGHFTYLNAEVFGLVLKEIKEESVVDFQIIPLK